IRFYTPEDARTVNLNNVQFAKDVSAATPSRAGGTAQPSEAAMQLLYEEERKTRESEYGQALALAREAEARQDYPAALDQYKVARELSRRLEVVKKVIEMERIIQRRNDWPLLRKQGDLAAQRRDYSQAVDLYNQVLRIKPDQTDLLNAIKELTQRIEAVSLVKNLYEQKKYDEALRECGRRLKKENDKRTYPELLLLRGRCYVASGRDKEALEAYTDVIGHAPDYLEARLARAELYERKADWAGAVAEYEVILQSIAPNDPALYARKAALQARANNPQAALEDYKKAIRLEATNPSHHYERGLVYLAQGDLAQARLDFDTAIRLDPAHARAYYGRAKAHLRANHLPEAAKDLEKARQSRLDPVSQDEVRRTSEQHYRDGLAHHEQKRFEEAIRQFDHALLLRPDYAEAWLAKGRAYSESNDHAAAKESHTQALAHRTTYAEAHYRRGLAELQLREYAPALADFQRAATLQPDYVDALINGGRTQIYLKDFAGAVATFQQVVLLLHKQARNAPRNAQAGFAAQLAETHLLLGRCHYETKNYPEAIKAFKAALDYNTNLSQAYYNRGMAHYEMNNAWEAIEDFSACLDKAPKQYEALYARAKAYELANRYERAVADYSNLLAKAESAAFQDAGYRRGASYAKQQNYVLALKDYEAYAKKYPREINDSINAEMGFLYLDAYQTSLALEKFERARAADSRNVPAMYGLAFAYAQASKIEQSVEWLRKALKADPTGWKGLKKETYLTNLRRNYFFLQLKKEYRLQ
ncbi:MAG: tetratricopeptide repeat protein, partial [Ferruginibacter sp.]|nr:tetratricopeptide repeat protein [Cytophagales bacterium]